MTLSQPQTIQDWEQIREICCLTGKAGDAIEAQRWPFFGENWIGPYQKLLPEWTWISQDEKGLILGYLTGCPDTLGFERKRRFRFDLPFLAKILLRKYPSSPDTRRFFERKLGLRRSPESSFPAELSTLLKTSYPAHLHINLRAEARQGGLGRQLMESFFTALREKEIPGVHVYCGSAPVPFYEKTGFKQLEKIEFAPGVPVFCLGKSLS